MEWNEKLQRVIDLIEEHLQKREEPIEIAEIVEIAGCSYTFFQKVFSFMNGISFAEYIRNRKMTLAGYDVKHAHIKIIELSYKYGYDSPTSFTKAFRTFHGITPKEARKGIVPLRIYPKMQILPQSPKYTWRIEAKPSLRLIGKKLQLTKADDLTKRIPAFWSTCQQDGTFAKLVQFDQGQPQGLFGIFHSSEEVSITTEYMLMVNRKDAVHDDYNEYILPACTWAIFDCIGTVPQAIQAGWSFLQTEWLEKYPFAHAKCPEIEWYSSGNIYDSNYLSQIWIPIIEEEK